MKTISIIIPAKNEEQHIGLCLNSLNSAKLCEGWCAEVIVVDNMSSDRTAGIARDLGANVVECDSKKIGEIRSFGSSIAKGEILAYVDADCAVKSCWLVSAICQLENKSIGAVGGYLDLPDRASFVERGWALPFTKNERENVELVGASLFIRRDVYDVVGGFNRELSAGEDSDLSERIIKFGYLTKMIPECNVVHYGYPSSVIGFIDRQIWQVSGQLSVRKMFFDISIFISIIFIGSLILASLALLLDSSYWVLFGLLGSIIPLVFGVKRVYDAGTVPNIVYWPAIYFVSILYFLGRFWGVIIFIFGGRHQRKYK